MVCRFKAIRGTVRCKWLTTPWGHVILLYSTTFLIILPYMCSNLQFSIYNFTKMDSKPGRDKMMKENHLRLVHVEQKKKLIQNTDLLNKMWKIKDPDLAITIITTARKPAGEEVYKPFYLTQVVWKMLWLIYEAQRTNTFDLKVSFSVCNVDADPSIHKEAIDLVSSLHVINKYDNLYDKSYRQWNIFEKEKQDYVYCLNSSLVDNPKFVLLVEDDSYPNNDLFLVLNTILSKNASLHTSHYDPSSKHDKQSKVKDATYIKLFHPERVIGYISVEPDRLTELFGISAVFGTILLLLYEFAWNYKLKTLNHRKMLWLSFMVYVALLAMAIGRPHLLNLRRLFAPHFYSFMSAPECCTPAMLFPNKGARDVVEHLSSTPCYINNAKDTVLHRYIKTQHHKAFVVQPNLFKHIGFLSSLRQKFLNPYVV